MPTTQEGQNWQAALTEHFVREYQSHPLPARKQLSALEDIQCRILGGTLISWLERHGPRLLQEREVLKESFRVEASPVVMIISDTPGLVAAREILAARLPFVFYLPAKSFEDFLTRHPDQDYSRHVVFTSCFHQEADEETLTRAKALCTLGAGEEFWLHREISEIADLFVRGGDHLWKWDGQELALVEERFTSHFA